MKMLPEFGVGVEISCSVIFKLGFVGVAWSGDWAGIFELPIALVLRLAGCGTLSYCYLIIM